MRKYLHAVLPKICAYFNSPDFMTIATELEKYNKKVERHFNEFQQTKDIWARMMAYLSTKKQDK
jgi:hypothetical protein